MGSENARAASLGVPAGMVTAKRWISRATLARLLDQILRPLGIIEVSVDKPPAAGTDEVTILDNWRATVRQPVEVNLAVTLALQARFVLVLQQADQAVAASRPPAPVLAVAPVQLQQARTDEIAVARASIPAHLR